MTQTEQCQELIEREIVRVDIMPTTALKVSIPFNVQNITNAVVTMADDSELTDAKLFIDSLLSLKMADDGTVDAEMQDGVSYKMTEKRDIAGMVRTHTLQIPIESGFDVIRVKEAALQHAEFYVVLTTGDGSRYLLYSVPNTSQFSVEEQIAQNVTMSVKVSLQSMSDIIRIGS